MTPIDTRRVVACGATLALLATTGVLLGQSLADVARKEQERRKSVKATSKVYTNEDLHGSATGSTVAAPPSAATAGAKPAPEPAAAAKPASEPPTPAEPVKDEAYWRGRITAVRAAIERNEVYRDALQSRLNALATDFVNRDDPIQRAAIAVDRQKALAEFERVQQDIQRQNSEIAAIEEEARRAAVPPGWLR